MIWIQFLATALVIVFAGVRLARYGDVLGEKSGLGRSWIGVVLLAATTSLPELFTGFGARRWPIFLILPWGTYSAVACSIC